jgi:cytosine/adenosine deaminase-related metal-dependent hydrolase
VVRNAAWLIAWDEVAGRHVYERGGDMAFEGNRILQVGGRYEGEAAIEIDGRDRLVMPGFVNLHSHPSFETMLKGVTEEIGSPNFYMTSLFEYLFLFEIDPEGMKASLEVALTELLQSGVTTLCDISLPHEAWLDVLAESGIRGFAAPMFRSGRWFTKNGHSVEYEFDIRKGRDRFEEALATVDKARTHPSGRLDGVVSPAQIDTCDEQLLRDAGAEARRRGMPLQIHASQSVIEFHEIFRRHGRTPVGWLDELGLLGPDMTIGHGIFLDHADWLSWSTSNDLSRLAETGTSVAHCPTVFVRRGITLQNFKKYRDAGVNIGIGTDTFPHNYIEEVRNAIYVGRTNSRNVAGPTTDDAFHAATVGGAMALGRNDIGKLAVGAKADFVMADLTHPMMQPVRDPLRSLIFSAGERPVREVYVDGRQVVRDGKALAFDLEASLEGLAAAQRRALDNVYKYDWASRSGDVALPLSLPLR